MLCKKNKVAPQNTSPCENGLHKFVSQLMGHVQEVDLQKEWENVIRNGNTALLEYEHVGPCKDKQCDLQSVPYHGNDFVGMSILFIAVASQKYKQANAIAEMCPDLINKCSSKGKSTGYDGLTPFHLVVAFGQTELVKKLIEIKKDESLLELEATGQQLEGTMFMGKLPLAIATCQNNKEMVDLLLKEGAEIEKANILGDTVFHALVKFVNCFPSKESSVLEMFRYLLKEDKGEFDPNGLKILKYKNKNRASVLQLAASFGIIGIFKFIMDRHLQVTSYDLAYEMRRYDITDMDRAALMQWRKENCINRERNFCLGQPSLGDISQNEQSVCQSICTRPLSIAVKMIDHEAILEILRTKWDSPRYWATSTFIGMFHLFFLVSLCVTAMARASALEGRPWIEPNKLIFFHICCGLLSLLYLICEGIVRVFVAKQPFNWTVAHHNVVYRCSALLFATLVLVDSVQNSFQIVDNTFLVSALLPGSWYLLCFLRCIPHLGVYIVHINEALMYGLIPLTVLILGQISVFSGMIHSLLLNNNSTIQSSEYNSYGTSMWTLFRLMMGLTDIEITPNKHNIAVTFLYVCYIIIVAVLLVNTLISIMTNQFKPNYENRVEVLYVQRLSHMIYIEGLFAVFLPWLVIGSAGTYTADGQEGTYTNDGQEGTYTADGQEGTYTNDGQEGTYTADGQEGTYTNDGQEGTYTNDGQEGTYTNDGQEGKAGRMILTFRKVRCYEHSNPKDIEHDRLSQYSGQSAKLDRIEGLLQNIQKADRICNCNSQTSSDSVPDETHVRSIGETVAHNEASSSKEVPDDILSNISMYIKKHWENVGIRLHLSQKDVNDAKTGMSKTSTCVHNMLRKWKDKEREKATVLQLISALEYCQGECEIDITKVRKELSKC